MRKEEWRLCNVTGTMDNSIKSVSMIRVFVAMEALPF